MRTTSFLVFVAAAALVSAQESAFDVASVRPSSGPEARLNISVPGEVTIIGAPLAFIISFAFDVDFRLEAVKIDHSKVSKGLRDTRFDIRAKGNPRDDYRSMLRTLLTRRFGMRFHRELREGALYALVVKEPGKLGPWMKPTNLNCESARETWLAKGERAPRLCSDLPRERRYGAPVHRWAGTVDELILRVAQANLPYRPVINATDLKGNYEWEVAFSPGESPTAAVPTIFEAFETQLGLKLDNRRGPYEVIVIDDLRMPTPN